MSIYLENELKTNKQWLKSTSHLLYVSKLKY